MSRITHTVSRPHSDDDFYYSKYQDKCKKCTETDAGITATVLFVVCVIIVIALLRAVMVYKKVTWAKIINLYWVRLFETQLSQTLSDLRALVVLHRTYQNSRRVNDAPRFLESSRVFFVTSYTFASIAGHLVRVPGACGDERSWWYRDVTARCVSAS